MWTDLATSSLSSAVQLCCDLLIVRFERTRAKLISIVPFLIEWIITSEPTYVLTIARAIAKRYLASVR